jgi:hypothetical protein
MKSNSSLYDLYTLSYAAGKVLKQLIRIKVAGPPPRTSTPIYSQWKQSSPIEVKPNTTPRETLRKANIEATEIEKDIVGRGTISSVEDASIEPTSTSTSEPLSPLSVPPHSSDEIFPSTPNSHTLETIPTSPVPSSRISRLMQYTSLTLSLSSSMLLSRVNRSSKSSSSSLTPKQTQLLVNRLRKMRGVALKFGQFMGLQEFEKGGDGTADLAGEEIRKVWELVMDRAEGMMKWQVEVRNFKMFVVSLF